MQSKLPYHIMSAIVVAMALSFAAGVQSASVYSPAPENAETFVVDFPRAAPVEYFPHLYQNQAKEIEPHTAQF